VGVEHAHVDSSVNVGNVLDSRLTTIGWSELNLDATRLRDNVILATVLITESVSTNNDWLGPAWHAPWNIFDDDRLSENSAVEDVSDGSIGTPPHLLEAELFDTALVRGDGGALDGNFVLLGCLSAINGDLIIGGVARCHRQVIVLSLQVHVRVDVPLFDPLPNDTGHLITIDVDNRLGDLHLAEGSCEVSLLLGNS